MEGKMKVLVTGGAGFIGSHVVAKLLQEQCKVVVIDNLSTGLTENVPEGVRLIEMDICSKNLLAIFQREGFGAVIHLAAQTMVPVSLNKPDYDCQINILGTVNVLEACRMTGVKRIVFASSAAVYGDVDHIPVVESAQTKPTSFYGLSKLTVEKYLQMYQQIFGLEYVILRYANVYGERQGDGGEGGVISIFARKISNDETVAVYGDGGQTRDFVYAGDVAIANYQAIITDKINTIYNISTQTEVSINQLIEVLGQVTGKKVEKSYYPVRDGDIYRSTLCNQAAGKKLPWQRKVSLSEGLSLTYHAMCT
jgi:UDP-glucose 4-epimerase